MGGIEGEECGEVDGTAGVEVLRTDGMQALTVETDLPNPPRCRGILMTGEQDALSIEGEIGVGGRVEALGENLDLVVWPDDNDTGVIERVAGDGTGGAGLGGRRPRLS
jgi:hypothetical protein